MNYIESINSLKKIKRLGMNFQSDSSILPEHYTCVSEPFYRGEGEHSIKELQELLKQYKEYAHQQAIIKQRLIEFITKD